jgi:hypothetical protein
VPDADVLSYSITSSALAKSEGGTDIDFAFSELARHRAKPIRLLRRETVLQRNVPALDITEITEGLLQNGEIDFFLIGTAGVPKHADARH